jgi:LPXTG-site transpeptidase (sortase) family protein
MILVGHNYGYGYNGVFVNVGRLKTGQVITVINRAGETFSYRVTTVQRVKWSKKNAAELQAHQAFLNLDGPERLTLVTCGGATWEPFPDRVYVVAEPVR